MPWLNPRKWKLPSGLSTLLAENEANGWEIPPWALAISLLPLVEILLCGWLTREFVQPIAATPLSPVADPRLAAAAELRMLATWAVMAALSVGGTAYFLIDLRHFKLRSLRLLLFAFVAFVLLGFLVTSGNGRFGRAEHAIGEPTICAAFAGKTLEKRPAKAPPAQTAAPKPDTRAQTEPPSLVAKAVLPKAGAPVPAPAAKPGWLMRRLTPLPVPPECRGIDNYLTMQKLNTVQLFLLLVVLPALVLGAISTLTNDTAGNRAQAARLKTYLYLAATGLVCGLLFLSALLRWPSAGLPEQEAKSYLAHVDAYLLYWGVAYSLFIISYYVPIVVRLSSKGDAVAGLAAKEGDGADDMLKPLDILKVMLALFAPVITALLGNVIKI